MKNIDIPNCYSTNLKYTSLFSTGKKLVKFIHISRHIQNTSININRAVWIKLYKIANKNKR